MLKKGQDERLSKVLSFKKRVVKNQARRASNWDVNTFAPILEGMKSHSIFKSRYPSTLIARFLFH